MSLPLPTAEPAVTVVEISDPTTAGAGIELIEQDVVQLRSLPLRARRVTVRLESAAVIFHSTNLPSAYGPVHASARACWATLRSARKRQGP